MKKILTDRWESARSWEWRNSQPWLAGCNYVPSSAVNQLEMWQADTFDLKRINRELGLLASLGMNSVRVFLHDLLWLQDPKGFLDRMDRFLGLAQRHGIGMMPVFFDSCWYPFPHLGPQRDPEPGVHNSFWVQSPGRLILQNAAEFARLKTYVTGVVSHFRDDPRIHVWDLWNEPDNPNTSSYGPRDMTREQKADAVCPLLAETFTWARSAKPMQPLTTGIWVNHTEQGRKLHPLHRLQLSASDVISFHSYDPLISLRIIVTHLKLLGRPLLCTEYMARAKGSTFRTIMPYLKAEGIAAYNWGSISGRSQTIYPWDSWQRPYIPEPPLWFHDIFRENGSPYDLRETKLIASLLKERPAQKKALR